MTGTRILDMDMAELARGLRGGWDWWLEELGGLVPPRWRARAGKTSPLFARLDGRDGFELTRRGQDVAGPRAGQSVAATVVLPASAALVREIWLPAVGAGDLRRLIALDIDRLMPFPPGTALIDSVVIARDAATQRQLVAVGALPRGVAEAAVAAAVDAGIEPRGLGIAHPDGTSRFDFLPGLAIGVGAAAAAARRFWWGAVIAGIVLNLAVLVARDINATGQLQTLVAEHGDAARLARTLRSRVVGEETRRAALVARHAARDPVALLADLTRLLPDGAWVQRLSRDARQLRLSGYHQDGVDVVAALKRSTLYAAARPTSPDLPPRSKAGQPYDVTVDFAAPAR